MNMPNGNVDCEKMQSEHRLEKIGISLLTPIVEKVACTHSVRISGWNHQILKGNWNTNTRLICRIFGKAIRQGEEVSWSVFLKVPNPTHLHYDPLHREPFQREVLMYQSGILDDLPGGIAAPRCLGVTAHTDDEPWMWLEDVEGTPSIKWPVERFEKTARQFGYMQGTFLSGRPLPDHEWLDTSDWLKPSLTRGASRMRPILESFKKHQLTSPLWNEKFGRRLRRMWLDREIIFEALNQMPRSLCHGDFCYGNLIAHRSRTGEDQTVVLDWQYAGVRQIGSDIAGLIADSSIVPVRRKAAEPEEFTELVLGGYSSGLQESGWKGDLGIPRFAVLATLAWPWAFNLAGGLRHRILQEPVSEENRTELEQRLDEYMRRLEFLFSLGDEAKSILGRLDLASKQ